jgi:hypothetical protein
MDSINKAKRPKFGPIFRLPSAASYVFHLATKAIASARPHSHGLTLKWRATSLKLSVTTCAQPELVTITCLNSPHLYFSAGYYVYWFDLAHTSCSLKQVLYWHEVLHTPIRRLSHEHLANKSAGTLHSHSLRWLATLDS